MLQVVDVGEATITKRDKAFKNFGISLKEGVSSGQDAYIIDRKYDCFAVADGVGSSQNSDVAARAVCEAYRAVIKDSLERPHTENKTERKRTLATLKRIHAAALGALATTTFTGVTVHPDGTAAYLHVGDSQLVLLRDDELIHYTSEQVNPSGYELLNYLGTQPEWATQGYERHSLHLTVHANVFSETKLEAEWGTIRLQDGDRFALMTDGITGSGEYDRLSDQALKDIMSRQLGATARARLALDESRKMDDSTLILFDIGQRA